MIFTPDQFTPTKWEGADAKARFANHFTRFVLGGMKWTLFHKWFYTRLSMTFMHIAHYNRQGFYCTWFDDKEGRTRFLVHTLNYTPVGSPEYTYSDVEVVLREWLISQKNLLAEYGISVTVR